MKQHQGHDMGAHFIAIWVEKLSFVLMGIVKCDKFNASNLGKSILNTVEITLRVIVMV